MNERYEDDDMPARGLEVVITFDIMQEELNGEATGYYVDFIQHYGDNRHYAYRSMKLGDAGLALNYIEQMIESVVRPSILGDGTVGEQDG